MNKKEEFKRFASLHPELVKYIKNGEASWQKFYEIYDIYGEDESAWSSYITPKTSQASINGISQMIKNVDMDSIQKHINTAQKALGFISELTTKNPSVTPKATGPITPRPLNKFFED